MQKTIYQKISQMREEVVQLDWSPDKSYVLKGSKIDYVTISKMRRNLSPLFARAGLDFDFNIVEVQNFDTYLRIKVQFILIDCETEDESVTELFADGMSTNDKGFHNDKAIEIALSYAMRMWVTTKFCIADGIELDTEGEQVEADFQENVRRTLDRMSVAEEEPVKTSAPRVVPVPIVAKVEKTDEKAGETTEKAPATEDKAEEVPATAPAPGRPANVLSVMEKGAADKSIKIIEKAYSDGVIVEDVYNKAKGIYDNLSSSKDVLDLLSIKKEIDDIVMKSKKDVGM